MLAADSVGLNIIRNRIIHMAARCYIVLFHLSQDTAFPTKLQMSSAKTQISLRIRAVWSESLLSACRCFGFSYMRTRPFYRVVVHVYLYHRSYGPCQAKRGPRTCGTCAFNSSCACAKYHPGIVSPFTLFCGIQLFCERQVKALIRLRACAGCSGSSLSVYAKTCVFAWRGLYIYIVIMQKTAKCIKYKWICIKTIISYYMLLISIS